MTRFIVSNFSLLATWLYCVGLPTYSTFLWPLAVMNHFPLISGISRGNEGGEMKSNAVPGKCSTPIVDVIFASNRKSLLSPRLFSASTFWARVWNTCRPYIPYTF